ncbi:MAG: hypothetical protein GC164_04420 [Phycisphaera sp.]|nr:hypothetical protein [Phycisphaera sp.]
MKYRNVNFFERHLEKIVVTVALVVACVVLYVFWLSNPFVVKTPDGQELSPGKVDKYLLQKAETVKQQVDKPTLPDGMTAIQVPDYTENFLTMRRVPLSPLQSLNNLTDTPLDPRGINMNLSSSRPVYVLANPPGPVLPHVRSDFAVMLPTDRKEEMIQHYTALLPSDADANWARGVAANMVDQIDAMVPTAAPRDFAYVSIVADFDLQAYWKAYEALPKGARIPEEWQRRAMAITDIELQRQTLDPATGQWSDPEPVASLPRLASIYNDLVKMDLDNKTLTAQRVRYITEHQKDIADVPFPPITQTRPWLPPNTILDTLSPELKAQWNNLKKQIEETRTKIEKLGGSLPDNAAPLSPTGFGESEGFDIPPSGPRPGNNPTTGQPANPNQRSIERLIQQYNELQQQLRNFEEANKPNSQRQTPDATGLFPSGSPTQPPRPGFNDQWSDDPMNESAPGTPGSPGTPGAWPGVARPGVGLGPDGQPAEPAYPTLHLLTHDITAQPGKTYRYRLRVSLLNPLFKQDELAPEQRETDYNKLSIESQWSDWSDPVKTLDNQRFFLVSATPQGQAQLELWRVYNGRARQALLAVGPGDAITQSVAIDDEDFRGQLTIRTGAVAVDINPDARSLDPGARTTVELLYLQDNQPSLRSRYADVDAKDPDRQELLYDYQHREVASISP